MLQDPPENAKAGNGRVPGSMRGPMKGPMRGSYTCVFW